MKMKVDLDELNPGVFFPFDDKDESEDPDGTMVRIANGEILESINKKCITKKNMFRRGQRYEVVEENEKLRSEMLWDYIIISWKGIQNEKTGEDIPCTTDNKILLMRGSVKFATHIGNCVEKLTEDAEKAEEDLEKN